MTRSIARINLPSGVGEGLHPQKYLLSTVEAYAPLLFLLYAAMLGSAWSGEWATYAQSGASYETMA